MQDSGVPGLPKFVAKTPICNCLGFGEYFSIHQGYDVAWLLTGIKRSLLIKLRTVLRLPFLGLEKLLSIVFRTILSLLNIFAGLVRTIDPVERAFYILTPEPLPQLHKVNCLVKGALNIPDEIMLKQVGYYSCPNMISLEVYFHLPPVLLQIAVSLFFHRGKNQVICHT